MKIREEAADEDVVYILPANFRAQEFGEAIEFVAISTDGVLGSILPCQRF
jgi:hypothetical protein